MKILSRDFTLKEKILILVLGLIIVVLAYVQFVDKPIRNAIKTANEEKANLSIELTAIETRLDNLKSMKDNLDDIKSGGELGVMQSYNNKKRELDLLNTVLQSADEYDLAFADVTRDGDQIRRKFSLKFTAADYKTACGIVSSLYASEDRLLLEDIDMTAADGDLADDSVTATLTATFYETLVDGEADSGLPADDEGTSETDIDETDYDY